MSDYSHLGNPSDYEHFVVLYSNKNDLDQSNYNEAISEYINARLSRNQLCIYAYIEKDVESAMAELSKRITNYEENLKAGNIMLVDFKPYCLSAMDNNLEPFKELMQVVKEKTRQRPDKHVRIIGRAAGWLYENKYFD